MARLHRQVVRQLVGEIARGEFREGEELPAEAQLAASHNVSRGVAREALRALEERGLVEVRHGRGGVVLPSRVWNILDGDVLGAVLATPRGGEILREFVETRRVLEVAAAAFAADRASGSQIMELSDALAQMVEWAGRATADPRAEEGYHAADVAFHRTIMVASGNRVLLRMTEPIQRALIEARRPLARPEVRIERGLPEHRAILTAIARRSPDEARAAMEEHMTTVESYLDELAGVLP